MGKLADMAKKRNPYLKLEAGESIIAVYKGFKMVPSSYDPEEENFRFILEVEIDGEKATKYWDTGSNKVALVFDTVQDGGRVKITKNVTPSANGKDQTSWEVEPVADEKGEVTQKEAEEINKSMAG